MPTVTETTVDAFAWCQDARCLGYQQEPVQAVRVSTYYTYLDAGGDMPGIEKSSDMARFADEDDVPCSHCEKPRAISEQERPEYPNISGHDPMGLFEFKGKTEGQLRELRHAQEVQDLKSQNEVQSLRAELAEMKAMIAAQARSKPGPKPKAPEDA